jgi:hypothetical protein
MVILTNYNSNRSGISRYAEKLIRNLNGYSLVLKNFDQEIPVSRQYILKVKNALCKE